MSENETEETEVEGNDEFVTHSQLEAMLDEKLTALVDRLSGDSLPETETTVELDEVAGNLSPSEIERLLEEKVAAAMKRLEIKKSSRPAAPKPKVKPAPATSEAAEDKPSLPGKKSLSERLWGK